MKLILQDNKKILSQVQKIPLRSLVSGRFIYLAEQLQAICILSSASSSTDLLYTINGT